MKTLTVAALGVAIVLLPIASQAEGARKLHQMHRDTSTRVAPALPLDAQARYDAYGNNANSPYGDNSAANNANGRTSGGGGFGGN